MGGGTIQSAVGGDAIVVVGGGGRRGGAGRADVRHTVNMQIIKDGGGTGHQTCGCCSKATQLGQVTLSVWKQRTS